jgi:hypothetical protein
MLDIVPVRWRIVRNVRPKYSCRVCEKIVQALAPVGAIEAEVRGQPPDVRRQARQERTRPLVDALRETLDAALRRLSPKSEMAKAIAYGTKRWPALCRFLDDGRLEIDNNIAERALVGIAVGRRNWLFAGSRAGGERAAAIYTSSRPARSTTSNPRPTSPMSSRRSPATGPQTAGTS